MEGTSSKKYKFSPVMVLLIFASGLAAGAFFAPQIMGLFGYDVVVTKKS